MTLIEIRPQGNGWKVFEASGVEPVFPEKDHAMGSCAEPRVFQLPLSVFGVWIRLRPAAVNVRAVYQNARGETRKPIFLMPEVSPHDNALIGLVAF